MSITDPSDISDLVAWYEAEDIIKTAQFFGNFTNWTNKGGSGGVAWDLVSTGSGAEIRIGDVRIILMKLFPLLPVSI